jgi:hypothetical protein
MGFWKVAGVASAGFVASVQAAVSSTGFTVSLEDVDYYLPPKPAASIALCDEVKTAFEDASFMAITVVKDGPEDIASLSATYADQDDVWQPAFLEGALFVLYLLSIGQTNLYSTLRFRERLSGCE